MKKAIKVSLITTERNEKDSIAEFIDSVLAQSQKPDEIVIADGGSSDGTLEIINEYIKKGAPIKLVKAPGNRSIGRNAATSAASNEYIACTDVGSRLDKNWLRNITKPFRVNPKAMVVSGFFLPEPKTFFEEVSATLMLDPNDKIDINTWLPSSRSFAYTKTAWKKVGGYPEYTNFNEDTPFCLALKKAGFKFEDGLRAIVYWRPRPNFKEFYRQYYFYALGDALDRLDPWHFTKLSIKYLATLVLSISFLFIYWPMSILVMGIFVLLLARRVYRPWRKMPGIKSLILMFLLLITFDLSQILGYWTGWVKSSKLKNSKKLVR